MLNINNNLNIIIELLKIEYSMEASSDLVIRGQIMSDVQKELG